MEAVLPAAVRRIWPRISVLPILAALAIPAHAASPIPVSFRLVWHNTKWESVEVGDEPGHILGVAEFKGLAFFEDGEVATTSEVSVFDQTDGHGGAKGYVVLTFNDGATQVIALQGADQDGAFKGSYSYARGSGRFEGIEGEGAFTGEYYDEVKSGYNIFTGSYALAAK
jgi:hypothetical protein